MGRIIKRMTTLNNFISEVRNGLAKNTHFTVEIAFPFTTSAITKSKMVLFCDQAQLPGLSFGTNQIRSYGEFKEVPYEKIYEAINLSFYVDAQMTVKSVFDAWTESIQDVTSRDFNWPDEYIAPTIKIVVENSQGDQAYMVTLYNCYPKSVGAIQLDYASKDVMKLSVGITYQYAITQQLNYPSSTQDFVDTAGQTMEQFNYGFQSTAAIPSDYINDFTSFQARANDFNDFTLGGVQSIDSFEDVGVQTGFGGIFI